MTARTFLLFSIFGLLAACSTTTAGVAKSNEEMFAAAKTGCEWVGFKFVCRIKVTVEAGDQVCFYPDPLHLEALPARAWFVWILDRDYYFAADDGVTFVKQNDVFTDPSASDDDNGLSKPGARPWRYRWRGYSRDYFSHKYRIKFHKVVGDKPFERDPTIAYGYAYLKGEKICF